RLAPANATTDRTNWVKRNGRNFSVAHSTTTGATTSALATSPSHQVNQMAGAFAQSAAPVSARLPDPMVALSIVPGRSATSANFATPPGVSKARRPLAHRLRRPALISASSVLPTAMAEDAISRLVGVRLASSLVALAANAPSSTAGHTRSPNTSMQPIAKPVAGQIGVALG